MLTGVRTIITNPTSVARVYGYVPPSGIRLGPGQSRVLNYDLYTKLSESHIKSLQRDIQNDRVRISVYRGDPNNAITQGSYSHIQSFSTTGLPGVATTVIVVTNSTGLPLTTNAGSRKILGAPVITLPPNVVTFGGVVSVLNGNGALNNASADLGLGTAQLVAGGMETALGTTHKNVIGGTFTSLTAGHESRAASSNSVNIFGSATPLFLNFIANHSATELPGKLVVKLNWTTVDGL